MADTRDLGESTLLGDLDDDADRTIRAITVEYAPDRAAIPQFSSGQAASWSVLKLTAEKTGFSRAARLWPL